MPRRSESTRAKLISAGRRRFAREGWTTARVRDIVADAEQSNDSAINYHFGSRAGLLQAILRIGVEEMDRQRQAVWQALANEEIDFSEPLPILTITDIIIRPFADQLLTVQGVEFVRIVGQLGPYTSVPHALQTDVLKNTVLHDEVERLYATVGAATDAVRATHRMHHFLIALIAILTARARKIAEIIDAGSVTKADGTVDPIALDRALANAEEFPHEQFVDELVVTLAAALVAH